MHQICECTVWAVHRIFLELNLVVHRVIIRLPKDELHLCPLHGTISNIELNKNYIFPWKRHENT